MASSIQISEWNVDDDEQKNSRKALRGANGLFQSCCCCCSQALFYGFVIGLLITGIALAVVVSLYVVDPKKTNNGASAKTWTTASTTTVTTITTSTVSSTSTTSSSSSTTSTASTTSATTTTTSVTTTSVTSVSTTTSTTSATTTTTSVTTTSVTSVTTTTTSSVTTVTTTTTTTTTTTAPYCKTRVTFDDISGQTGSTGLVPNGYYSFNWTNAIYANASSMPNSGFRYATQSSPYVAYSPSGYTMVISSVNGSRFSFDSIVVTSAWRDTLTFGIQGGRGSTVFNLGSLGIHIENRTTLTCTGCSLWDRIYFLSSGGTPRAGLQENGTNFIIDDLCISFGY